MGKAARAIILHNGKIMVMHRNKSGSQYYTLVGGRIKDDESLEQGLVREIKEETGLNITSARLVFVEEHAPPNNEQYIYLCEAADGHESIGIQSTSEEGVMNHIGINVHKPLWAEISSFSKLPFRTPQLQSAIVQALKKGFPKEPVKL